MKLKDFDYNLPKELIAQEPMKPRDHSRLLCLDKKTGKIEHKYFYNIVDYFQKGDVLVFNNSKVLKARLIGQKKLTGGKMEVFLLPSPFDVPSPRLARLGTPLPLRCDRSGRGAGGEGRVWQCLVGGRGAKEGLEIEFGKKLSAVISKNNQDGTWLLEFNQPRSAMLKIVEKIGLVPLPPYIKRNGISNKSSDIRAYQTVYADAEKTGSVAAPTAGLHFTPKILNQLKKKGVQIEHVTLHVGLGTFAPVKVDDITKHKMHGEWVEVRAKTLKNITQAKKEGRRVIAVGTTSTRTLEAIASKFSIFNFQFSNNFQFLISNSFKQPGDFKEFVNIFIYPGYKFQVIDGMITNFHLPKSTLLMLISALAGKDNVDRAYCEAIKKKYRFFSYGDAMLIT